MPSHSSSADTAKVMNAINDSVEKNGIDDFVFRVSQGEGAWAAGVTPKIDRRLALATAEIR